MMKVQAETQHVKQELGQPLHFTPSKQPNCGYSDLGKVTQSLSVELPIKQLLTYISIRLHCRMARFFFQFYLCVKIRSSMFLQT